MAKDQDTQELIANTKAIRSKPDIRVQRRYRLLSILFGSHAVCESVATELHVEAHPQTVWHRIRFYEEISSAPPLLLRTLIPRPMRTQGDKSVVGARILCTYERGSLVKQITALQEPCLIQFEVIGQHLGIESCVTAQSGSYRIRSSSTGSDVLLTTNYHAYLRPRWLWRALERLAVHQLHSHILDGMCEAIVAASDPAPAAPEYVIPTSIYPGEETCTASQSHFHQYS